MRTFVPLVTCLSLAYTCAEAEEWMPCGGSEDKLWAWAWTGDGAHVDLMDAGSGRERISVMRDLSGNGHHYFNDDQETIAKKPAYELGLKLDRSWGTYETTHAPFMRDNWNDGSSTQGQWFDSASSMSASGPFYLVYAGVNTRVNGSRDMWGISENNLVRMRQEYDDLDIVIDGGSRIRLTEPGAIPKGPIIVEIWRDSVDSMHVWVNGEDKTSGTIHLAGSFVTKGFGWKRSGTSHWDDYAFEIVTCNGLPTDEERTEVREYLREKWQIYGASNQPDPSEERPPNPPTDVRID
jgi:hypothetical protein